MSRYITMVLSAVALSGLILMGIKIHSLTNEIHRVEQLNYVLGEYYDKYQLLMSQYEINKEILDKRNQTIEELRYANELYEQAVSKELQSESTKAWSDTALPSGVINILYK